MGHLSDIDLLIAVAAFLIIWVGWVLWIGRH